MYVIKLNEDKYNEFKSKYGAYIKKDIEPKKYLDVQYDYDNYFVYWNYDYIFCNNVPSKIKQLFCECYDDVRYKFNNTEIFGVCICLGLLINIIGISMAFLFNSLKNLLPFIIFVPWFVLPLLFYVAYLPVSKQTRDYILNSCVYNGEDSSEIISEQEVIEKNYHRVYNKRYEELTRGMASLSKRQLDDISHFIQTEIYENENLIKEISLGTAKSTEDILEEFDIKEEKRLKNHIVYEGRIGSKEKRQLKNVLGYTCAACGKKMDDIYGYLGANYIELHHKIPYADLAENDTRMLNITDFCVLCPNCHRMIHKFKNADDIELLSKIVKANENL